MGRYILEACVDSVESAVAAQKGGADRLELCANLVIGGTTPSLELYRRVREVTNLPVHVLIRPRFGDFLYTQEEYGIMCRQIRDFTAEGADAVVIGSLCADGSLNEEQMMGMMDAAAGKPVTLHRAFDVCRDPWEALDAAKALGVHTILTSGQEANCYDGRALIGELARKAGSGRDTVAYAGKDGAKTASADFSSGTVQIMAGGGVCAEVIETLMETTSVCAFHMSGKVTLESGMVYCNPKVNMGLPGISEFEVWRTSEEAIQRAAAVLKKRCEKMENCKDTMTGKRG